MSKWDNKIVQCFLTQFTLNVKQLCGKGMGEAKETQEAHMQQVKHTNIKLPLNKHKTTI